MEMHCIFVCLLCFVLFYFTLRFVFAKYWLVLILTRAISTTGHPALSRSHHVRSHTVNFLTPKIILVIDKSDSRFAVVRFCEITDRIGLHSLLLPLLIIWEKPMKFFFAWCKWNISYLTAVNQENSIEIKPNCFQAQGTLDYALSFWKTWALNSCHKLEFKKLNRTC